MYVHVKFNKELLILAFSRDLCTVENFISFISHIKFTLLLTSEFKVLMLIYFQTWLLLQYTTAMHCWHSQQNQTYFHFSSDFPDFHNFSLHLFNVDETSWRRSLMLNHWGESGFDSWEVISVRPKVYNTEFFVNVTGKSKMWLEILVVRIFEWKIYLYIILETFDRDD